MQFATHVRTQHVARLSASWCSFMKAVTSIALPRNLFGIGHMYITLFCLHWPTLWPPRILIFPLATLCMYADMYLVINSFKVQDCFNIMP
jgi:hypothetical protein